MRETGFRTRITYPGIRQPSISETEKWRGSEGRGGREAGYPGRAAAEGVRGAARGVDTGGCARIFLGGSLSRAVRIRPCLHKKNL